MIVLVVLARWDYSVHFDFQVWQAATQLADAGENPYDIDTLNDKLREISAGGYYTEENREEYRMQYFSPPWWLVQLKLLRTNALAMSLIGAILSFACIGWLGRDRKTLVFLAAVIIPCYLIYRTLGESTFWLGQTGLWLSGLAGLYLVLNSSKFSGGPLMAMAFKPYIAIALRLPKFITEWKTSLRRWLPVIIVCVAASAIVLPAELWVEYVKANLSSDLPIGYEDMTLRTLSAKYLLSSATNLPFLAVSIAIAVYTSYKWRHADHNIIGLWAMAIIIFGSGHGYSHDWLWLIFIPVVCKWRALVTILVGLVVAQVHAYGWDVGRVAAQAGDPQLISVMSIFGLAITSYLGWASYQSSKNAQQQVIL